MSKHTPDLSSSVLGEIKFAVRQMLTKKERELGRMHELHPSRDKVAERVNRLREAKDWLRKTERQLEDAE